jgi:hypothetical protein
VLTDGCARNYRNGGLRPTRFRGRRFPSQTRAVRYAGTIKTGQEACCAHWWLIEPSSSSRKPPRPREPTTSSSAPVASLVSTLAAGPQRGASRSRARAPPREAVRLHRPDDGPALCAGLRRYGVPPKVQPSIRSSRSAPARLKRPGAVLGGAAPRAPPRARPPRCPANSRSRPRSAQAQTPRAGSSRQSRRKPLPMGRGGERVGCGAMEPIVVGVDGSDPARKRAAERPCGAEKSSSRAGVGVRWRTRRRATSLRDPACHTACGEWSVPGSNR